MTVSLKNKNKQQGISLKPDFYVEREYHDYCLRLNIPSIYLTETKKEQHKLTYDPSGIFYVGNEIARGRYLFTRLLDGTIYVHKTSGVNDNFHHSYFSNGENVSSVGYFEFEPTDRYDENGTFHPAGTMLLVSNESGHYCPTNDEMLPDINFFYSIAKNSDLIYEDHSKAQTKKKIYTYKADEFIRYGSVENLNVLTSKPAIRSHYGNLLANSTLEIMRKLSCSIASAEIKTGYASNQLPANSSSSINAECPEVKYSSYKTAFEDDDLIFLDDEFQMTSHYLPDEQLFETIESIDEIAEDKHELQTRNYFSKISKSC